MAQWLWLLPGEQGIGAGVVKVRHDAPQGSRVLAHALPDHVQRARALGNVLGGPRPQAVYSRSSCAVWLVPLPPMRVMAVVNPRSFFQAQYPIWTCSPERWYASRHRSVQVLRIPRLRKEAQGRGSFRMDHADGARDLGHAASIPVRLLWKG